MGETPEAKAALAFYTSAAEVSRSLIGAPGIPADRLKALRDAFQATTRDPDFLAEIKKSQSEFDPAPGEYLRGSRQEDRGDAAGDRAAHGGGVTGEVTASSCAGIARRRWA